MDFVAIDFETAIGQDTPCAVGIVSVENNRIVDEYVQLIKPPNNLYNWHNTKVHNLSSADTVNAPKFEQVYPEIKKRLQNKIVVAHSEQFDRSVLQKTMQRCGLNYSELNLSERWECTFKKFKGQGYASCSLGSLCQHHDIKLNHHEALSDARGCAALWML